METLTSSFFKAFRSLFAPGMFGILLMSIIITIISLTIFVTAASTLMFMLFGPDSPLSWLGSFGAGIFAWFLFPAIMPVIVNFFDTRIVRIVEKNDYPGLALGEAPAFWGEFWHDARFTTKALLINMVALPFYLIPVFNLVLFYTLNGYMLGREFFVMAARQHMPVEKAEILRKQNSRLVTLSGVILAISATIPIVNLFAPIWGIAMMTHLYHGIVHTPKVEIQAPYSSS